MEVRANCGAGIAAWAAVMSVLLVGTAQAVVIGPGGVAFPAPSDAGPTGTVIATSTLPFVGIPGAVFQGTVTSQVISGDTTNPHGGLTFTYQFTNDQSSDNSINRLTATPFGDFLTDVSFVDGTGVVPAFIDRGPSGDPVGFSFNNAPIGTGLVNPGDTSAVLVVRTDAPALQPGIISLIDGGTGTVVGFAPIPEPGMLSLIAGAGLMMLRRRRA
jgi:hypothetical protein